MAKRPGLLAAVMAIVLPAGPGLAQDAPGPSPATPTMLACRNAGQSYKVGEYACIAACHERRRFARCDVISARATWTYLSDACPSAMINPPWPSDHSELLPVTAMSPVPLVLDHSAMPPDATLRFATFRTQVSLRR